MYLNRKWFYGVLVCVLLASAFVASAQISPASGVSIDYETIRFAFWRGKEAQITLNVVNSSDATITSAVLSVDIASVIQQDFELGDIEKFKSSVMILRADTKLLKTGEYQLVCKVFSGKKVLADEEFTVWVARKWNPERMRQWFWTHHKFGEHILKLDGECKRQLQWYADKGVNSFQPGWGVDEDGNYGGLNRGRFAIFDYGLVKGWEMTFAASGGFYEDVRDSEARFSDRDGSRLSNPFHPKTIKAQNDRNREIMEKIKHFPGVKLCFFNSELEDQIGREFPLSRKYYYEPYPETVPHKFISPGVIADNDEGYVKNVYYYKWGDGITAANERAAKMVHRYRPDIKVFADPLRRSVVYNRYRGMDFISTWTYTNPDPKYMLFIETLIANGKPFGQGALHTITALNYPGTITPEEHGWTIMGPDRLVETSWINLSRNPAGGLSMYSGSGTDQFEPAHKYPYQVYPETFEALKEFSDKIAKPYGPMIRKLKSTPRKVAVLSSIASRVYPNSPPFLGYYSNMAIYSFYSVLNMNHIPADVVFDETITDYGIDEYDVLVMPMCETLTETVYNRILDFGKRGGLIISDQYLRAEIPNVI